ncbi:MAG: type II toxin-antitoxin system HipA family toxin [Elusimicrobiota bacterium]
MNNLLNVYWAQQKVGRLWLTDKRAFIFQYDSDWVSSPEALPISLRLPLQAEPFETDVSKPFFTNLLPEADIRDMIAKNIGVSTTNDFKLLEELGGECAGALSLLPDGLPPEEDGSYEELSEEVLDHMIEAMPRRALIAGKDGLRLSLAGAQHKLPVYVKDGSIFLPKGAFSSSHILKPTIPDYTDTVENEAFCMMLARECALPVPKVDIRGGKIRALQVERYDRTLAAGSPIRLHQEDFCQALGYNHDQKYESAGGPGLKECFTLLEERSSEPIIDKRNLLRWVVFNYLIGNCDAHAKNASILITRDGIRLAPFYDLMSTVVYPELSKKLAMKIGGENRPNWIMKRHWERLAEEADVGVKAVLGICNDLGEALLMAVKKREKTFVPEFGAKKSIREIAKGIEITTKHLTERLSEAAQPKTVDSIEESAAKYVAETKAADDFLYAEVASKFMHFGGWEVLSHPTRYKAERLPDPRDVKRLVSASEVSLRGWNFPHTDKETSSYFLKGYQSKTTWERYIEGYRAYQSGLFVWKRIFWEDLENKRDEQGRRILSYIYLIWETTEIFLFLKQYYGEQPLIDGVHVSLTLNGTGNRNLVCLDPGIDFRGDYIAQEPQIVLKEDIDITDLRESWEGISNRFIMRILPLFGAEDFSKDAITNWQKKLIEKRF